MKLKSIFKCFVETMGAIWERYDRPFARLRFHNADVRQIRPRKSQASFRLTARGSGK